MDYVTFVKALQNLIAQYLPQDGILVAVKTHVYSTHTHDTMFTSFDAKTRKLHESKTPEGLLDALEQAFLAQDRADSMETIRNLGELPKTKETEA